MQNLALSAVLFLYKAVARDLHVLERGALGVGVRGGRC